MPTAGNGTSLEIVSTMILMLMSMRGRRVEENSTKLLLFVLHFYMLSNSSWIELYVSVVPYAGFPES